MSYWSWDSWKQTAEESLSAAKDGLTQLGAQASDLASKIEEETSSGLKNVSEMLTEQKKDYESLDRDTELKRRLKEEKSKTLSSRYPPWAAVSESDEERSESDVSELRRRILEIADDSSTLLIAAPSSDAVFSFALKAALPLANSALNEDLPLGRVRFELVPRRIQEKEFWRNYFYRVQLIRESMGFSKLDLSESAKLPKAIEDALAKDSKKSASGSTNDTESSATTTMEMTTVSSQSQRREVASDSSAAAADTHTDDSTTTTDAEADSGTAEMHVASVSLDGKHPAADGSRATARVVGGGSDESTAVSSGVELSGGEDGDSISSFAMLSSAANSAKAPSLGVTEEEHIFMDDDDIVIEPDIDHLDPEEKERMKKELGLSMDDMDLEGLDLENINTDDIDDADIEQIMGEVEDMP